MDIIDFFNENADNYDKWFDKNKAIYKSELDLISMLISDTENALSIGVGTGRFAGPLGIKHGIDPSEKMLEKAKKYNIETKLGFAENLPYEDEKFSTCLFVTTFCYIKNPRKAIEEAFRVLKMEGTICIGIIDKDSVWGEVYIERIKDSNYYKNANFISVDEIISMLLDSGFSRIKTFQTLCQNPFMITKSEDYKSGHGTGAFSAIVAKK